jgi:hypothetical protein
VSRFLPTATDRIWVYDVEADDPSARGMFISRMHRVDATRFELRTGSLGRMLEYRPDGIVQPASQTYLLKAPVSVGSRWPGEGGSEVRVAAVDRTMRTAAGVFTGCIETVQTVSVPEKRTTTTVYCPDVGIVELGVEAAPEGRLVSERARLRSFGAPVDVGQSGVTR